MLREILSDPLKLGMLIILVTLEVPAAIILACMWRNARRGAKEQERSRRDEKGEDDTNAK